MHPFRHQETDLDGMDSRPLEARSCLVAFRQVILGAVRRRAQRHAAAAGAGRGAGGGGRGQDGGGSEARK